MAFATSTELFENIFHDDVVPDKNLTRQFLIQLTEYLETKTEVPEAQEMAAWLKDGNPISVSSVRGDMIRPMIDALRAEGAPYVVTVASTGETGMIFRDGDEAKFEHARTNALEKSSRYCKVVSGDEMLKSIVSSKEKDKSVLVIGEMDRYMVELLKEKYEAAYPGSDIGIDVMEDGTYSFYVYGRRSMKQAYDQNLSINELYLEMLFDLYGENKDANIARIENKIGFEILQSSGFHHRMINLHKSPLWIVGEGNQYMRMDASGFEVGRFARENGGPKLFENMKLDSYVPDYEEHLNSYLSGFVNPTCTTDVHEFMAHLQHTGADDPLEFKLTPKQMAIARGNKELASVLGEIVTRKIRNDSLMLADQHWDEKFLHFQQEAGVVMEAVLSGKVPPGYDKDDIKDLVNVCQKYDLDIPKLTDAASYMRSADAHSIIAHPERIESLEKRIQQELEGRGRDDDRESRGRGRGRASGERTERHPRREEREEIDEREERPRRGRDRSDGREDRGRE